MRKVFPLVALPLALLGCESSGGGEKTTPEPEPEAVDFGHCSYVNKFSKGDECRQYQGKGWTQELVEEDCAGQNGQLAKGACSFAGSAHRDRPDRAIVIASIGHGDHRRSEATPWVGGARFIWTFRAPVSFSRDLSA